MANNRISKSYRLPSAVLERVSKLAEIYECTETDVVCSAIYHMWGIECMPDSEEKMFSPNDVKEFFGRV